MKLTQHPLSAAWPAMSAEDFQVLKDSIEVVGVLNPIVIFEGQVIDGWHRYTASAALGMPCPTVELDDTDPVDFVKAMNEARRHLTASQRAVAIVSIYGWRLSTTGRPRVEVTSTLGKTNAELAKEAGVSTKTIQQAKDAKKAGLDGAVKDGSLTAEQASNIAKGKPAKPVKPEKPAPVVEPEAEEPDDYTELDAAHDQITELQSALVVARMGDVPEEQKTQASDHIAALIAELATANATIRALTISRDTYMTENAQMKRQMKAQREEIARLKANK